MCVSVSESEKVREKEKQMWVCHTVKMFARFSAVKLPYHPLAFYKKRFNHDLTQ